MCVGAHSVTSGRGLACRLQERGEGHLWNTAWTQPREDSKQEDYELGLSEVALGIDCPASRLVWGQCPQGTLEDWGGGGGGVGLGWGE